MSLVKSIPERYRSGFVILSQMEDKDYENLRIALANAPITLGQSALFEIVAKTSGVPVNTKEIFDSMGSLSGLGDRRSIPANELAGEAIERIRLGDIKELGSSNEELLQKLKSRIEQLLETDSLYYSAKAYDVLTEHEHIYGSSRVLTDCRPVFSRNLEKEPKVAVIFHMLQIHYHEGGEHKEIYFALDGDDVVELREMLERAEKKAKKLRSEFLKPDIRILS